MTRFSLALTILAASACGSKPAMSQGDLHQQMNALAATNDSIALGKLAWKQCGSTSDQRTCIEDFFVSLAGSERVSLALGSLASLAKDHPDIEHDGHGYTHVIGIRAWKPGVNVANVFKSCNGLFQSGCYHGVIQAYLTEGSNGKTDSTRAVALCDEIAPGSSDRWLRFQCVHGIGHGFEMVDNWDLLQALKHCDWLNGNWDRSSCYGGAFMENAVASMPGGHHTASRTIKAAGDTSTAMAGMDMPAGHSHGPDPSKATFKMRDPNDALYPCSIVGDDYQFSCYQLQGGIILARVSSSFPRAAAECDKVPLPINRAQCYVSLGTNASGMSMRNASKVISWCSNGDEGYQPFCFSGAVKNFVDVTAKYQDGFDLCAKVAPGANRDHCFVAVGEEISVLYAAVDARATACGKSPAEGLKFCKIGAQLPD